ncbi:thioredoxin domain-containing protein [Desulfurispirillum indicum S5]|uniref:Thioredoxin domain-containing protein n=1 Tax=Desulfurispirillum indicum (strain ATCC BAA-1389 / DSM 22839 / S5) TaxID=653733 RepID=E6W6W9_DESIS|nr:conjugal transfer protein TraF [Desulfurispirillum indicum]ADU66212.1 thioredoxin domain-containing protein [Desulfurispirillum indicum S5]
MLKLLTLICTMAAVVLSGQAAALELPNPKRGFWWGERAQEEQPVTEETADKAPDLPAPPLRLSDFTPEELWTMPPSEFSELVEKFSHQAIQFPTEENAYAYLALNDISRRKALEFTNITSFVSQRYPEFSPGYDHPTNVPGRQSLLARQAQERQDVISSAANEFGLLYFHDPSCSACVAQEGILQFFNRKYPSWGIRPVNIRMEPYAAAQFGVQRTPTIIAVHLQSDEWLPVTNGAESLDNIEERLFWTIRYLRGETNPQNFGDFQYQQQRDQNRNHDLFERYQYIQNQSSRSNP